MKEKDLEKRSETITIEEDGIEFTPEQLKQHRFSRKILRRLDYSAIAIGISLAVGYVIFNCLPKPAQQAIQDIPANSYELCSDVYQFINQFMS